MSKATIRSGRGVRAWTAALAVAALGLAVFASAAQAVPATFWGVVPQATPSAEQFQRLQRGGVDSVRFAIDWGAVQPSRGGAFDWAGTDGQVALAAKAGIEVLPFLDGAPSWAVSSVWVPGSNHTVKAPGHLPATGAAATAWSSFVAGAVARYGPNGTFWAQNPSIPKRPIRNWQIWNEENFYYFAKPVSPGQYARLLAISKRVMRRADPRAELVLGGLFGDPPQGPPLAMDAVDFLDRLYRVRGVKASFDAVALHPYAAGTADLRSLVEEVRRTEVRHHDARAGLYLTELGWGSQDDPRVVAFEVGLRGQARELRSAFSYLIHNHGRLGIRQVDWFTWKDIGGSCTFCDSSGLFRRGAGFRPKPAWRAYVSFAR
jgi:hypothetical protein